jgi:hypothetical protein
MALVPIHLCLQKRRNRSWYPHRANLMSALTARLVSPCEQYCYSGVDVHTTRTLTVGFMTQSLYIALSYCWSNVDEQSEKPRIFLDGVAVPVPPNLHRALLLLSRQGYSPL